MQTNKDLNDLIKDSYPLQPKKEFVLSTEHKLRQTARNMNRNAKIKRLSYVSSGIAVCVLVFSWLFLFSGKDLVLNTLTSLGENESGTEETTRNMEAVLKNALAGPSDELKQLLDNDNFEGLNEYEEKRFKEFFSDVSSYEEFLASYGTVLMIDPMRYGYQISVKNIEYEKTASEEIIYNFNVEVQYEKENSGVVEVGIVTGQANLDEQYKIEDMKIDKISYYQHFLEEEDSGD